MQTLLDIAGQFAIDHGLRYSFSKTRYMLFRRKFIRHVDVILKLRGMVGNNVPTRPCDVVVRAKLHRYLGFTFHESGAWTCHANLCLGNARARMADLRSTVTCHDMLSPATSIDTIRTYVQSALAYSGFLWLPLGDLIRNAVPPRFPAKLTNKLRKMYNGTLRAIGGLASHSNMTAANRILGWEGNLALALKLRIGSYDRVMRQPRYMKVRKLMVFRMRSVPASARLDGAEGAYVPGASSFCWDV